MLGVIQRTSLYFIVIFLFVSLNPLQAQARLSNIHGLDFTIPQFESSLLVNSFTGFVSGFFNSITNGFRNLNETIFDKAVAIAISSSLEESSTILDQDKKDESSKLLAKTELLDLETLKSELKKELEDYVRLQVSLRPSQTQVVYTSLNTPVPQNFQSLQTDEIVPIIYRTVSRQSDADASRRGNQIIGITEGGTFTDATISGVSTFSGTTGTFSSGLTVTGNGASITGDLTINGNTVITEGDIGFGTTTPYGKLSIQGTVTTQPSFVLYGVESQTADLVSIYDNPTSNTNLFTITSAGLVGIGTTSPYAKLSIDNSGNDTVPFAIKTNGSVGNYTATNSGIFMYDAAGEETLRIVASDPDPTDSNYNDWNLYIGRRAGFNNPSDNISAGYHNTGVGYDVLYSNTTGSYNTALGATALYSNTIGDENIALGELALYFNTTGSNNTALGSDVAHFNTTGSNNTALGRRALHFNTTGEENTASGASALSENTTGNENSAFGRSALFYNTTGNENTALGLSALFNNTTGNENIALGRSAGRYIADGLTGNETSGTSVYLGNLTKAFADGDANEIVIGYNATGIGTNSVVLGNDSITKTILKGNVGIGTTSPYAKLSIHANNGDTSTTLFAIASSTASATTTHFVVTNAGNVGIGTTSPDKPLYLESAITYALKISNPITGTAGAIAYNNASKYASFGVLASSSPDTHLFSNKGIFAAQQGLMIMTDGETGQGGSSAIEFRAGGYRTANLIAKLDYTGLILGKNYTLTATPPSNGAIIEGLVGIGTTSPWATLSVNGTIAAPALVNDSTGYYLCLNTANGQMATSTTACGASSERYKENIESLSYGLDTLLLLNPVSFNYKTSYIPNAGRQLGFIAEEVDLVIPELVARDGAGKIQGLDYPKFASVIVRAVQELYSGLFARLTNWFADATNGIDDFFANRIHTREICVADDTGETCITKSELDQLLGNAYISGNTSTVTTTGGGGAGTTSPVSDSVATTTSDTATSTDTTTTTTTEEDTSMVTPDEITVLVEEPVIEEVTETIPEKTVSVVEPTVEVPVE